MSKKYSFPRVNLIPRDRRSSSITIHRYAAPILIAAPLLIIAWSGVQQHLSIRRAQEQRIQIEEKRRVAAQKMKDLADQLAIAEKSRNQNSAIQQILARKIAWSDYFKEMSMTIPRNIWINSMTAGVGSDGRHEIEFNGSGASPAAVSDFFQILEQSYFFQNIMIVSSNLDSSVSPPLYRFRFKCPMGHSSDREENPKESQKSRAAQPAAKKDEKKNG